MKSYTDLEQSKKLAGILPITSIEFAWNISSDGSTRLLRMDDWETFENTKSDVKIIPCWSLAALLDVLPYTIKLSHDTIDVNGNPAYKNESYKFSINRCGLFGDKWNIQYYGKHQRQLGKRYKELYIDLFLTENCDKLIDACYEMILKLNKQNLI